jgi:hypothetical protein
VNAILADTPLISLSHLCLLLAFACSLDADASSRRRARRDGLDLSH